MSKFNTDEYIMIIDENNTVRRGIVKDAYDSLRIAIVKFEDGATEKVPYDMIGRVPEEPKETVDETKEPTESTAESEEEGVLISAEQFLEITAKLIAKREFDIRSIGAVIQSAYLAELLFDGKNEPTLLTREKLRNTIIKFIGTGKAETLGLAMTTIGILADLPYELFGEINDEVVEK